MASPIDQTLRSVAAAIAQAAFTTPEADISGALVRLSHRSLTARYFAYDAEGKPVQMTTAVPNDALNPLREANPFESKVGTIEILVARDGRWKATGAPGHPYEVRVHPLHFRESSVKLPELEPDQHDRMRALWEAGKASYDASAPATTGQLDELQETLDINLPPALRALLELTNGAEVRSDVPDDEVESTLTRGWALLSASEIATHYRETVDAAHGAPGVSAAVFDLGKPHATQPRILHPGWVPFAHDYGSNYLGVDTVPGESGTAGQVIEFGRDLPTGPVVRADSLIDFFAGQRFGSETLAAYDRVVSFDHERALGGDDVAESVQRLQVVGATEFRCDPIVHAQSLKSLLVRDTDKVDLRGLAEIPLLELCLIDIGDVDLGPLDGHPTLRSLVLEGVPHASNLKALQHLPRLEEVTLGANIASAAVEVLVNHPTVHRIQFEHLQPLEHTVELGQRFREAGTPPVPLMRESGVL